MFKFPNGARCTNADTLGDSPRKPSVYVWYIREKAANGEALLMVYILLYRDPTILHSTLLHMSDRWLTVQGCRQASTAEPLSLRHLCCDQHKTGKYLSEVEGFLVMG